MLQTQYSKKYYERFPSMDHFSDCFGTPRESWKHTESTFWVSEKLDGANLGLYIPASGYPSCFSRSGEDACTGLFKFIIDKDALEPLVERIQKQLQENKCHGMYLWGEYYGNNVCRRINYKGEAGQFKFFDGYTLYDDGEDVLTFKRRLTPPRMQRLAEMNPDLSEFFVPYYKFQCASFLDLKNLFPLPAKSSFSEDPLEGYVITEVDSDQEFIARWKYKDPRFKDHAAKKKIETSQNPQCISLQEEYQSYFCENRVLDLLSKTTERTRLDVLVQSLIKDAREDFIKNHEKDLLGLSEKEKRFVFYAGSIPFNLLKEVLLKQKYESN